MRLSLATQSRASSPTTMTPLQNTSMTASPVGVQPLHAAPLQPSLPPQAVAFHGLVPPPMPGQSPQSPSYAVVRKYRSPTGSYVLDALAAMTSLAALAVTIYYAYLNWQVTVWTATVQMRESCMTDMVSHTLSERKAVRSPLIARVAIEPYLDGRVQRCSIEAYPSPAVEPYPPTMERRGSE